MIQTLSEKKTTNISIILMWFLAILPACLLGIFIVKYSVDFPYWDQWAIASVFEKFNSDSLGFDDLISQHNESRKIFPRLIFLSLGYLTHWNVRYEMLIIFLLACLVSLNIYRLNKITISGSTQKKLFVASIANLFIFSPIQWENWLWGIQIVVFIPIACLTTCISIAYSTLATRTKFLASMCLCTFSTFSYANGILLWFLVLPSILFKSGKKISQNLFLILTWFLGFVINAIIYFHNYSKPSHHPEFKEAVVHPLQAIHYFLSFLGAPLGLGSLVNTTTVTAIIGLILFTFCIFALFYILINFKDNNLLNSLLAWVTLGSYTLISAAITTLGRVGFGIEQSLSSRYTTFSVYLIVALIYIYVIIADDFKSRYSFVFNKLLARFTLLFVLGITLILHYTTFRESLDQMSMVKKERLQIKSCLLFINIVQEDCLTKRVFPDTEALQQRAKSLNSLGFLKPSLVENKNIRSIQSKQQLANDNYGWFDVLRKTDDNQYFASGWAILPYRQEPADSVLLTYEDTDGNSIVFSLIDIIEFKRQDVAVDLNNNKYIKSGWEKTLSSTKMPAYSTKITAWAFDANKGRAFKLNGVHKN